MVIVQSVQQKNDQGGNHKHIINFSWPCLVKETWKFIIRSCMGVKHETVKCGLENYPILAHAKVAGKLN